MSNWSLEEDRETGKIKTIWRNNGLKKYDFNENYMPKKHEVIPRHIRNQVA